MWIHIHGDPHAVITGGFSGHLAHIGLGIVPAASLCQGRNMNWANSKIKKSQYYLTVLMKSSAELGIVIGVLFDFSFSSTLVFNPVRWVSDKEYTSWAISATSSENSLESSSTMG